MPAFSALSLLAANMHVDCVRRVTMTLINSYLETRHKRELP